MGKIGRMFSTLVSGVVGVVAGSAMMGSLSAKKIKNITENGVKLYELYMAFNQWVRIHQEGKTLVDYFKKCNYKTVAIYGMKELGERLYDELEGSGVIVSYIIDKNATSIYANVDVVTPDDKLEPVDVIVVTAIHYYDEIEEMLSNKVDYRIVSLEDILYEV